MIADCPLSIVDCRFDRARVTHVLRAIAVIALALVSGLPVASAQSKPPVRMKMELMSINNRSSGPVPVRIRLEYNEPTFLQGTLELFIYDALDFIDAESLLASYRREDIVLASQDYEFIALLPPLPGGMQQNWAVQAWFVTEKDRIPLSSLSDRIDPPEPHDLITTNPSERGTLVCSCVEDVVTRSPSANRMFLESALSLDNYNPWHDEFAKAASLTGARQAGASSSQQISQIGQTILHYASPWSSRDLPVDPLSYCAFDVVLLTDGGLGRLTTEQLDGLRTWVRAGGSVCILPDEPMKPVHLQFIRDVMQQGIPDDAELTLGPDGRLLLIDNQPDRMLTSFYGLGRAVLLPDAETLETELPREDIGRIVGHLWKVRRDQPVHSGSKWTGVDVLAQLREFGINVQIDDGGVYITDESYRYMGLVERASGGWYVDPRTMLSRYGVRSSLSPQAEPLLTVAESALLPQDIAMVPTWVIGVILFGYVMAVGPIDYFVLGWLRLRKYTWIAFPIVTACFTIVTIGVANSYMSSTDTGGRLVITDVVDDGVVARQTTLETLYFSSQSEARFDLKSEFVVAAEDTFSQADWAAQYGYMGVPGPDPATRVVNYSGHFPQNYGVSHQVKQWSPKSLRRMTLEPGEVVLPDIDWSDATLVTTADGRQRLRERLMILSTASGRTIRASVLHAGTTIGVTGSQQLVTPQFNGNPYGNPYQYNGIQSRAQAVEQLMMQIPTMKTTSGDFFAIVSQVAPQGAGSLEDLAFVDPSDERQWALVVFEEDGDNFHAYRKLYVVGGE